MVGRRVWEGSSRGEEMSSSAVVCGVVVRGVGSLRMGRRGGHTFVAGLR